MTRSPFKPNSTANVACPGDVRSAVYKNPASAVVHPTLGSGMDTRPTNVLGRVGADAAVDVGEAVVATHRRQSPINRRGGQSTVIHRRPGQLDVRPRGGAAQAGQPRWPTGRIVADRRDMTPACGRGSGREGPPWRVALHPAGAICPQYHPRRRCNRIEHRHREPPGSWEAQLTSSTTSRQPRAADATVRDYGRCSRNVGNGPGGLPRASMMGRLRPPTFCHGGRSTRWARS